MFSSNSSNAGHDRNRHAWKTGNGTLSTWGHIEPDRLSVPFDAHSQITRPIPDDCGVHAEPQPHCDANFSIDTHGRYDEPIDPAANINFNGNRQYLVDVSSSSTLLEDAQYLLGPYANHDDQLAILESIPAVSNLVERFCHHPYKPLEQPMSIDILSKDVFPNSALLQGPPMGFAPPAIAEAPQSSGEDLLTCPIGCEATFSRPGEYRRHMNTHGGRSYPCNQHSCSKSFYRKDKLRDHLRQGHKIAQA